MEKVRWGILGTGSIAHEFTEALKAIDSVEVIACGSRTLTEAEKFQNEFNIRYAHGSYEELAKNPEVDIIYIATPHVFHKDNALLCLKNGKHILVEKPFAINREEAQEVFDFAMEKSLFAMEAFWTKCLPVTDRIKEWIREGKIGKPAFVSANMFFRVQQHQERLLKPHLGGGALLDIGVYSLNFITDILERQPDVIEGSALFADTGVDETFSMVMKLGDTTGHALCSMVVDIPFKQIVFGDSGRIEIDGKWGTEQATLFIHGEEPVKFHEPFIKNGLEYEAMAASQCVRDNKLEYDRVSHQSTLDYLEIVDALREAYDHKYPTEENQ